IGYPSQVAGGCEFGHAETQTFRIYGCRRGAQGLAAQTEWGHMKAETVSVPFPRYCIAIPTAILLLSAVGCAKVPVAGPVLFNRLAPKPVIAKAPLEPITAAPPQVGEPVLA